MTEHASLNGTFGPLYGRIPLERTCFRTGYYFYVVVATNDGQIIDTLPFTSRAKAKAEIRKHKKLGLMFDRQLYLAEREQ